MKLLSWGGRPGGPKGLELSADLDFLIPGGRLVQKHKAASLLRQLAGVEQAAPEALLRRARPLRDDVELALAEITLEGASWAGLLQGSAEDPYDVVLDLHKDGRAVGLCSCPGFEHGDGPCKHVIAMVLCAIQQLGAEVGRAPVPRPPAADAWRAGLKALDTYLARGGYAVPGQVTQRERLGWRLSQLSSSEVVLSAYLQKPTKSGYTKGARLSRQRLLERHDLQRDPEVAAVCRILRRQAPGHLNGRYGLVGDRRGTLEVLLALVGSERLSWFQEPEVRVTIERAALRLRLSRRDAGAVALEAWFGQAPFTPRYTEGSESVLVEVRGNTVWIGEVDPLAVNMASSVQRTQPVFPLEAWELLIPRLERLEGALPVEVDEELKAGREPADDRLRVRLTAEEALLRVELRVAPAPGALAKPGEGEVVSQGWRGTRLHELVRDFAGESALGAEVAQRLGLAADLEGCQAARWSWPLELVRGLELVGALEEGYTDDPRVLVEWPLGERLSVSRELTTGDLRVAIDEKRDWFGLEAGVVVDGRVIKLEKLLKAVLKGERYVALDRGRWLTLSRTLQEQLKALVEVAQPVERAGELQRLELDPTAAPVIEGVLREAGQSEVGERWAAVQKRLTQAQRVNVAPPKALRAELRDYQLEGFAWLKRLGTWGVGACLADDMGLGKTLQALAVLLARKGKGPALVVAPTSVGGNWARELERFAPTLRAIDWRSSPRNEAYVAGLAKRDVVIVSYDLARIDRAKLATRTWGSAVYDEAQQVKNSTTKTAQALRAIPADWRLALTGTPVENHLGDLWSLFALISPGLFGSWERFKRRFAQPIERDRDSERAAALARLIQPFVLRRTKEAVLKDLPPRTEINLAVELSPAEEALYEETRLATIVELTQQPDKEERKQRFQILAALTRLRQLACHPALVDAGWRKGSAKLTALLELVHDLREGGHRALVFSQFVRHLGLVREALEAAGFSCLSLDGSTPAAQRQKRVDAFQAGEGELFLISLKAGGKGLNLTGADYVIHLDPWWNPAVEDQASDRAHRIGQTRPVTVYRLVTQGTIEDTILELHAEKRDLVDQVLAGSDRSGKLSPDELLGLLRGGGDPGEAPPLGPDVARVDAPRLVRDVARARAQAAARGAGEAGAQAAGEARARAAGSARPRGAPPSLAALEGGGARKPSGAAQRGPTVGSRLKELRTIHRLTQAELASLLGVSTGSVSRWERGYSPGDPVLDRLEGLETLSGAAVQRALRQL